MTTSQNKAEASLTAERELWVSAALLATLNEILDAVILVLRGKFGTLALYDAARNARQIVTHRRFDAEHLKAVSSVSVDTGLAGSRSIRQRKRVIVVDVNEDPEYEPW